MGDSTACTVIGCWLQTAFGLDSSQYDTCPSNGLTRLEGDLNGGAVRQAGFPKHILAGWVHTPGCHAGMPKCMHWVMGFQGKKGLHIQVAI